METLTRGGGGGEPRDVQFSWAFPSHPALEPFGACPARVEACSLQQNRPIVIGHRATSIVSYDRPVRVTPKRGLIDKVVVIHRSRFRSVCFIGQPLALITADGASPAP